MQKEREIEGEKKEGIKKKERDREKAENYIEKKIDLQ